MNIKEDLFLEPFSVYTSKGQRETKSASCRVQLKLSHYPIWHHQTKWEGPEKSDNSTRVSPKNLFRNQSLEVTVLLSRVHPCCLLELHRSLSNPNPAVRALTSPSGAHALTSPSSAHALTSSSSAHALTSPSADRDQCGGSHRDFTVQGSLLLPKRVIMENHLVFPAIAPTVCSVSASFYDIVLKYLNF